jgi:hypothetical protein
MVKLAKEPAKVAKSKHPLAPVGRPPKVRATAEVVSKACADIRKGLSIEAALVRQGVAPQTMDVWRKKNPQVDLDFKRAEADFEDEIIGLIRGHAAKDSKSAQWLAERRLRGTWLPPAQRQELTGKDGGPIQALTLSKVLLSSVAQAVDAPKPMKQAIPA